MKMLFLIPAAFAVLTAHARTTLPSVKAYVAKHKKIAIAEMHRTHVPASIILSQDIIESGRGTSPLAKKAHNYFSVKKGEHYKVYKNFVQSVVDHSNVLKNNARYARLFKLSSRDYRNWAIGLYHAGYAEDPDYPGKLIKCIERNNLGKYDFL